jgi:hypothetical protein
MVFEVDVGADVEAEVRKLAIVEVELGATAF